MSKKPYVQELVEEFLGIHIDFLMDRHKTIANRLIAISKTIKYAQTQAIDQAIDECLYLSIGILFMGSEPDKLEIAKSKLREKLELSETKLNPEDVAAIAVFWYLVTVFPSFLEKADSKIRKNIDVKELSVAVTELKQMFSSRNWLFVEDDNVAQMLEFV